MATRSVKGLAELGKIISRWITHTKWQATKYFHAFIYRIAIKHTEKKKKRKTEVKNWKTIFYLWQQYGLFMIKNWRQASICFTKVWFLINELALFLFLRGYKKVFWIKIQCFYLQSSIQMKRLGQRLVSVLCIKGNFYGRKHFGTSKRNEKLKASCNIYQFNPIYSIHTYLLQYLETFMIHPFLA